MLEGDSIYYFGAIVPQPRCHRDGGCDLGRMRGVLQVDQQVAIGIRLRLSPPKGYVQPIGSREGPRQFALLKVKEIKNVRLAMFSNAGIFCPSIRDWEGTSGEPVCPLEQPIRK